VYIHFSVGVRQVSVLAPFLHYSLMI